MPTRKKSLKWLEPERSPGKKGPLQLPLDLRYSEERSNQLARDSAKALMRLQEINNMLRPNAGKGAGREMQVEGNRRQLEAEKQMLERRLQENLAHPQTAERTVDLLFALQTFLVDSLNIANARKEGARKDSPTHRALSRKISEDQHQLRQIKERLELARKLGKIHYSPAGERFGKGY